jgi:hypothetical protein
MPLEICEELMERLVRLENKKEADKVLRKREQTKIDQNSPPAARTKELNEIENPARMLGGAGRNRT